MERSFLNALQFLKDEEKEDESNCEDRQSDFMLAACVDGFDESGTGITSLDYFVYIWNLFNMMPIDSNDPLRIESVEVEKKHLFQCFSRLKCFHVWLTKNPPNIRGSDVKSLVLFFEEFLKYTFLTKTSLEPHYMESVSCLILLSWWNIGFRSCSILYRIIDYELFGLWFRLIPQIVDVSFWIINHLSPYPEHSNLFIINLLRVYADCYHHIKSRLEKNEDSDTSCSSSSFHSLSSSSCTSSPSAAAVAVGSRMTGIDMPPVLRGLTDIYRESVEELSERNKAERGEDRTYLDDLNDGDDGDDGDCSSTAIDSMKTVCSAIVEILKNLVRSGRAYCLEQTPDFSFISFTDQRISGRLYLVRDYLLVRSHRVIASQMEPTAGSVLPRLPKMLNCLVNLTSAKHHELLSCNGNNNNNNNNNNNSGSGRKTKSGRWGSTRKPWSLSSSPSLLTNHYKYITWCLRNNLCVKRYAFWYVATVDITETEAPQLLIPLLLPHAKLLAEDHSFACLLILRLDRVRRALLPEKEYFTLFHRVFKYLSLESKYELLRCIQEKKNSVYETPLSKSNACFQSSIRPLFNRLASFDSNADTVGQTDKQSILTDFTKEFLSDCEVVLFTHPVHFFTELIQFPVRQQLPHLQTVVQQLIDELSYALPVPTDFSPGETKVLDKSGSERKSEAIPGQDHHHHHQQHQQLKQSIHSTIFQELILVDWSNRPCYSNISLFGEEDIYSEIDKVNLLNVKFNFNDDKCLLDQSDESNNKLSRNLILDTLVHLFKKPDCIIQINTILQVFQSYLKDNLQSLIYKHSNIEQSTPITTTTAPTTSTLKAGNKSPTLQSMHVRGFIDMLYRLIKAASSGHELLLLLNKINICELLKQFMQLFNILFLNQFNNEFTITPTTATTVTMTTTPESQSTCASSVFIPLPDLDDVDDYEEYFEYLIISEVDVMLLELIAHCLQLSLSSCPCNRQTEGDGEREDQISCHINNTLRLLHTFKNDIVNSKSTRDWCKQKWSYLFNSSIFASMTALKLKQHKCCLKSINVLKDEVFKLSIEMSSQTLNTLTQLMDINVFYRSTGIHFKAISSGELSPPPPPPPPPTTTEDKTKTASNTESVLPTTDSERQQHTNHQLKVPDNFVSPRVIHLIFEIASYSNQLCSEVLKSILKKAVESNRIWCQLNIKPSHLLISVLSFLRIISVTGQIRCWRRLYFLLGRLMKAGVLTYPIPTFLIDHENGRVNSLSRHFFLIDWSKLHGTLDLFALTFHVFDLWCKASSSCASNNSNDDDDVGSHRELCILLHSLTDLVSNFTSVIPKLPPSETETLTMTNETTVNGNNNDDIDNKTMESSLKLNQSTVTPSETTTNQLRRRSEAIEESIVEVNNSNYNDDGDDNQTNHSQMNESSMNGYNNNDDNKHKVRTTESVVTTIHQSTLPSSKREEKKKNRKSKMKEVSRVKSQDNKINNNNSDDDSDMDNKAMESTLRHYQFVEYARQSIICLLDELTRRLQTATSEIPGQFHIETTTLNPLFNVSLQFDQLKETVLSIRQGLHQK